MKHDNKPRNDNASRQPTPAGRPVHVRFITLSQSGGSMEQFVTTFNEFCRRDDIDIQEIRLHEEYDEPLDMFDDLDDSEKSSPFIDIIHDVVAEIWLTPSDGPATRHARIFVSEDFKDELRFYEAVNAFCSKVDMIETVRAGSPYNRSLVALYRGYSPNDEDEFVF